MKVCIKTALLSRPDDKNEGDGLLDRNSLPILIESDGQARFCIPAFDEEDFILACQYLYYCKETSLISDNLYDRFEKAIKKIHPDSEVFDRPGSDKEESYTPHVRALALYLAFKFSKRKRKPLKIRLIR